MMPPGGKLTTLASGMPTDQKVNKADELTYLSTNIYIVYDVDATKSSS